MTTTFVPPTHGLYSEAADRKYAANEQRIASPVTPEEAFRITDIVYHATYNTEEAKGSTVLEERMWRHPGANWHPAYLAARKILAAAYRALAETYPSRCPTCDELVKFPAVGEHPRKAELQRASTLTTDKAHNDQRVGESSMPPMQQWLDTKEEMRKALEGETTQASDDAVTVEPALLLEDIHGMARTIKGAIEDYWALNASATRAEVQP